MRLSTHSKIPRDSKGAILVMVLVFVTIFLMIMGGLLTLITTQHGNTIREVSWHRSLAIAEAGVNYYRWHLAHEPEDFQDGTGNDGPLLQVSNISMPMYETAELTEGQEYYVDRSYTLTDIPDDYEDLLWIKTANDDKDSTEEQFLQFEVNREVNVLIAYDDRASSLPDWLVNEFTPTGDTIQVNDTGVNTLNLYEKKFFSGDVVLGGNMAAGASGAQSMYVVLIQKTLTKGPYVHDYTDPLGGVIGQYSLEITPNAASSTQVTIKSTGWTTEQPDVKRTILARYGIWDLTRFAYLTNSNIWFGEDEEIKGEVHSNGGIRMDGEGNARMTSARETYICGPEHGCPDEEKPGVWGIGEGPEYWEFPVGHIDFDYISILLSDMKDEAIANGEYLPPSGSLGYHITFVNNGTFNLNRVTGLWPAVWGYNGTEWVLEANSWRFQSFVGNYPVPDDNVIFVEDNVWVDGELSGNVTVASGVFPETPATNTSIRIQNDIKYWGGHDGSSKLGLIAQKDVLIPLRSEDTLEIDAVMLAQNGHVFRYYYSSSYSPWHSRNKIEVYGTIITNTIWTFSWVNCAGCPVVSGYRINETNYDSHMLDSPPPFFPTSGEYTFISWEELLPGEKY